METIKFLRHGPGLHIFTTEFVLKEDFVEIEKENIEEEELIPNDQQKTSSIESQNSITHRKILSKRKIQLEMILKFQKLVRLRWRS